MSRDPVALVRRYHAALNHYDAEEVRAMFAADAVYDSPGVNGRLTGRDAIIAAFSAYFAEYPDQQAVDDRLEQLAPDAARASWRLTATARSTGRTVTRRGTETVHFDADGLIAHVVVADQ